MGADRMMIVPYMLFDGVPSMKDSELMELYECMVWEGTAETVFYDGGVKSKYDFLSFIKGPGVHFHKVLDDDGELAGVFWLTDIEHKSAVGHFCFFSSVWGDSQEYFREIMKRLLLAEDADGEYMFHVLIGVTPEWLTSALKMIRKAGMIECGRIPYRVYKAADDNYHAAVISYFTREELYSEGRVE